MDTERKKLIITLILAVVLIVAWVWRISTLKKKPKPAPAPAQTAPLLPQAEVIPPATEGKVAEEEQEWGRDPFSGKSYSQESEEIDLKLSGIIWEAKKPEALINDEFYGEGDKIGNFQIIEIEKEKVILSDGNREVELTLQ